MISIIILEVPSSRAKASFYLAVSSPFRSTPESIDKRADYIDHVSQGLHHI